MRLPAGKWWAFVALALLTLAVAGGVYCFLCRLTDTAPRVEDWFR